MGGGKEEKGKGRKKRGGKGKERQGKKRENGEEKKGNCKSGGGKLKMEGERYESQFVKTTEICLGCTKMEISTGKKLGNGKLSNLTHLRLHTWLCP